MKQVEAEAVFEKMLQGNAARFGRKFQRILISTFDVFIQTLSLAKEACGILLAQVASGTAAALLTMILVRLPLLLDGDGLLTHVVRTRWTGA